MGFLLIITLVLLELSILGRICYCRNELILYTLDIHDFMIEFPTKHALRSIDETLQYSAWHLQQLLKIHKKSNFDRNQLKLSTQHKYMYMYQKKL